MSYWDNTNRHYRPQSLRDKQHSDFNYFVVDDFLDDPVKVRNAILNLEYEPPPNQDAGIVSFNSEIPGWLLDELQAKIAKILDKTIEFHPRSKCTTTYESVPLQRICHVDGGDNMEMFNWTIVMYLNLPEQCRGGTRFFRHLSSGDTYNKSGVSSYRPDFCDESKWEMVEEVQMKFNRVLFSPAWLFHSIAFTFGDSTENARLTVNPKVIAY